MNLEYQRYGRNKDTVINHNYIEGGEYRRKFDRITNNKAVNRVLYNKAKEMLFHRSGTLFEDMYWIDGSTGKVAASALNEQYHSRIMYSKAINEIISKYKNLIVLHTHPCSSPPSIFDFNAAFRNGYKKCLIICHNGTVYEYYCNEKISTRLYEAYVAKFLMKGYNEIEAQVQALNELKRSYDIDFWEVISK